MNLIIVNRLLFAFNLNASSPYNNNINYKTFSKIFNLFNIKNVDKESLINFAIKVFFIEYFKYYPNKSKKMNTYIYINNSLIVH